MQVKSNKALSTRANRSGRVGIYSLWSILGALAVVMLCPVAPEAAHADTPVSAGGSSLSVSVSNDTIALEADPSVNSGMALGSVTVSAQTTNETGYTMKLSANNTALKSADTTNTATVPTLASNTVLTSFPANRWGYYFGTSEGIISTTYKPISTTAADIDSTTAANSTPRTRNLTIAARVDSSLPADTYSTQLMVSVVGNAPLVTIEDITTMQEMTRAICSATIIGTERELTDSRDGNKYWVGKMKGDMCWMLQNLALGKTSGTTALTPADSNVSSNWSLPASLNEITSSSPSGTVSWNLGKWVLATPLLTTGCGNNISMNNCTKVGFVDVSDTTKFQPGYTATTGTWNGATVTNNTLVTVKCTAWSGSGTDKKCIAGTYDSHYLVGNYYQWNTATAGTGGEITSGQASGSICPKGWILPRDGTSTVTFNGLLGKYGVKSSLSGTINGTTYDIAGDPLRFVRSGNVYLGLRLEYAGNYGKYWTSTPDSDNRYAYSLNFGSSSDGVNPSGSGYRSYGFPVRCVGSLSI